MKPLFLRVLLCVAWLLAAGAGIYYLSSYAKTPGAAGHTPEHWPPQAGATRDMTRPTLVMFAHPQCPCSRASIGELNRLLSRCEGRIAAQVYFLKPDGTAADWTQTDLWRAAAAIPGVAVHEDGGGMEAQRFGAETSGYVVFYNSKGELLFHGGITGERGHLGDNTGVDALIALVSNTPPPSKETPVYGCSLFSFCPDSADR